jgi:ubiquinone/menaquinone biosynthesis C-methylase UbiE
MSGLVKGRSLDSKRLSLAFHNTIGTDGLSGYSKKEWNRAVLKQVESLLHKDQRILDVGCGYGRTAVPLLKKGYDIYGIDLSKKYVTELKRGLSSRSLKSKFRVADMCSLPFGDAAFDIVLCLWSVLDELLFRKDQVRAVEEMQRVLKKGGSAFIEGHLYMEPTQEQIRNGDMRGYQKRIMRYDMGGVDYYHYNHDEESLRKILVRAGIKKFSILEEWFGWRERRIIRFSK